MEPEEENDGNSAEDRLAKFDYLKFSIVGKTHNSNNNEESVNERQPETDKPKKRKPAIIITD